MARLRPVTGYKDAHDWTIGVNHPKDDGIFIVDSRTDKQYLLVSFEQMAAEIRKTEPHIDELELFINHTLWNRDGDRIFSSPGPVGVAAEIKVSIRESAPLRHQSGWYRA